MENWERPEVARHVQQIVNSYKQITGGSFIPENLKGSELSYFVYTAPFVLVAHGNEADPIYNYANITGQEVFRRKWEDFIKFPSRLSAPGTSEINKRLGLIETGRKNGLIFIKEGLRVTADGQHVLIKDVNLWNVFGDNGQYIGQAAKFDSWEYIEKN